MSNLTPRGTIKGVIRSGGGGGVTDYDQLTGRPSINNNLVTGSKGGNEYGLMNISDIDITKIYDITHGYNYSIDILGESIHITDQTFKPATSGEAGAAGLVPRPTAGDNGKILSNEGWIDIPQSSKIDILWSGSTTPIYPSSTQCALSDSLTNYDFLYINGSTDEGSISGEIFIIDQDYTNYKEKVVVATGCGITFIQNSENQITLYPMLSTHPFTYKQIIGIKL